MDKYFRLDRRQAESTRWFRNEDFGPRSWKKQTVIYLTEMLLNTNVPGNIIISMILYVLVVGDGHHRWVCIVTYFRCSV